MERCEVCGAVSQPVSCSCGRAVCPSCSLTCDRCQDTACRDCGRHGAYEDTTVCGGCASEEAWERVGVLRP